MEKQGEFNLNDLELFAKVINYLLGKKFFLY
jgi:hypothetical protein